MLAMAFLVKPVYFYSLLLLWTSFGFLLIRGACNFLQQYAFSRTDSKQDDKALGRIRNVAILTIFSIDAYLIMLYAQVADPIKSQLERVLMSLGVFLLLLGLFECISIIIVKLQNKAQLRHNSNLLSAFPFFRNVLRVITLMFAILWILEIYDVSVTPFLASAGVLGVAVAFASKDFVANLFGGMSVFFDKPYSVGDYVIIQEKYRGEVMEIGMRSTKIKTRDNILLTVPNSVMVTNVVINETGYDPELRVRIPILVKYDSDLDAVEHTLLSVAASHSEVLKQPLPIVRYREFGDSGMSLELLIVISNPGDKGRIVHEMLKMIYARFSKERISIPYQTQDIYIHKTG